MCTKLGLAEALGEELTRPYLDRTLRTGPTEGSERGDGKEKSQHPFPSP